MFERLPALPTILLAVFATFFPTALVAQEDGISGVLSSFGYGYEVSVWINGHALTQIDGGDSESIRIFSVDHPRKADMPASVPDEVKAMFCLERGENRIRVRFERLEAGRPLEVKVEIPDLSDEPRFRLASESSTDADQEFVFEISAGSAPVEIGDEDLGRD